MADPRKSRGLAFCMDGDPHVQTTTRDVARVPLSDYIYEETDAKSDADPGSLAPIGAFYAERQRFLDICAKLEVWQDSQSVIPPLDDRMRFLCILRWLATPQRTRCITIPAAEFLQQHVRNQYELLKAEDRSLRAILEDRLEEAKAPTDAQVQQVRCLDKELRGVVVASRDVRELLESGLRMSLVTRSELHGPVTPLEALTSADAQSSAVAALAVSTNAREIKPEAAVKEEARSEAQVEIGDQPDTPVTAMEWRW